MKFNYKKFVRKDSMVGRSKPFITLRPSGVFAFNSEFSRRARLNSEYELVTIYPAPEDRVVGFRFHNNKEDRDAWSLYGEGASSRCVTATALFKIHKWIKAVAQQDRNNRRFEPEWDKEGKMWFIRLVPSFEERVERKNILNIPSGLRGIYRYLSDNETVYIGQGQIRSQAKSPQRKEWNFDTIEYSVVEEESERKKYESYWLERLLEEKGKLPFYNQIAGKREK